MEGATIRSEQGVTLSICLVFWIDSLLHYENYKLGTAGKLPKEPLTVPSIIRQAQYDNLVVFLNQVQEDSTILTKWFNIERKNIERKRKKTNTLIELKNHSDCYTEEPIKKAA